jgi:hypothetical protein
VISGLDSWILAGALLVQMGLIAGLLMERRRRRHASDALDERLSFETLLSDLSADFAGPHVDDGKILAWLERLVVFLDVDRAALIPVSPSDSTAYGVLSYARPGIAPCPTVILQEEWPWYIQQVRRGLTVNYTRIAEELPPEAVLEREYVRSVGMKSHLSVPIMPDGTIGWQQWIDRAITGADGRIVELQGIGRGSHGAARRGGRAPPGARRACPRRPSVGAPRTNHHPSPSSMRSSAISPRTTSGRARSSVA